MFKRNQIEEAIAAIYEPGSVKPSSEMRISLKRLLDVDRGLGRNKRSADPETANFAFYSTDAPGRGGENWFSNYEAFALLTALKLMGHGWPQGFVVATLRRVRPELEKHHARILREEPSVLFDKQAIQARAQAGTLAVENIDPVFLVILSSGRKGRGVPSQTAVCRGERELMDFIRNQEVGQIWTLFELVNSAHTLSAALAKTIPRKRGRESD